MTSFRGLERSGLVFFCACFALVSVRQDKDLRESWLRSTPARGLLNEHVSPNGNDEAAVADDDNLSMLDERGAKEMEDQVEEILRKQERFKDVFHNISMAPTIEEIKSKNTPIEKALDDRAQQIEEDRDQAWTRDAACRTRYRHVDVRPVAACVNGSATELRYPDDAEVHFNAIRMALLNQSQHAAHAYHWAAGYNGPWVANEFVHRQEQRYRVMLQNSQEGWCLPDIFGPYIPILLPWTDVRLDPNHGPIGQYSKDLVNALLSVLRRDVPYVVVCQSDRGWDFQHPALKTIEALRESFPGLTILSAGGYGHVPVPLFSRDLKYLHEDKDVLTRSLVTSYVGSLDHAPKDMRNKMHQAMLNTSSYKYHHGPGWTDVMLDTKFNLVPRGFGRTAYHLMETLQLARIPIYIYTDTPWIPYQSLLLDGDEPLAYAATVENLTHLLDEKLVSLSPDDVRRRERRIADLYGTHFSARGAMEQIDAFLIGRSDLECRAAPTSPRDE